MDRHPPMCGARAWSRRADPWTLSWSLWILCHWIPSQHLQVIVMVIMISKTRMIVMKWDGVGRLWLMRVFIIETQTQICWEYFSWWVDCYFAWLVLVSNCSQSPGLTAPPVQTSTLFARPMVLGRPTLLARYLPCNVGHIFHLTVDDLSCIHYLSLTFPFRVAFPLLGMCVKAWSSGRSSRAAWWLWRMSWSFRRR